MSSEQQNFVPHARVSNKLTLDSEQQQRLEEQQRQRLEEIQKRKQQKRRRKEQAERQELQRLKAEQQKLKKYEQPQLMFQEDSDAGIQFRRVQKKIAKTYPQFTNKYDNNKKKNDFIVDDDEDDQSSSDDSGQSSQSRPKKVQKQKKIQKKQKQPQKIVEKKKVQPQVKKQKIKIEHKSDKKQRLVRQVSIRWWYALPEWPPADYDYEGKLKDLGYRVLDPQRFKLQDDVVNGLQKVMAVYGYKGVYKSKTKLIDVRPKQSAPTLNNFRNMSIQQLTQILKKALTVQIEQLKQVKYKQKGQDELMEDLQRELKKLRI